MAAVALWHGEQMASGRWSLKTKSVYVYVYEKEL